MSLRSSLLRGEKNEEHRGEAKIAEDLAQQQPASELKAFESDAANLPPKTQSLKGDAGALDAFKRWQRTMQDVTSLEADFDQFEYDQVNE